MGVDGGGCVVSVPFGRDEDADRVIAALEDALLMARETPCSAVSIFLVGRDGMNLQSIGFKSRVELAGALALQLHEVSAGG